MTSFAALAQAARRDGYSDAAIAAGRRAAALGCTDAEVEMAADEVWQREEWRAKRGGIDEPAVWAARALDSGILHRMLDEPGGAHDPFGEWLPMPTEGEQGLTLSHLFALLELAATVTKERDCAQAGVFYCWAYHLCGRPNGLEPPRFWTRANGRVAPLPCEGPRELEPTAHAKATHSRFKRMRDAYHSKMKAVQRRLDQSVARGSVAKAEDAFAALAAVRCAHCEEVVYGDELQPEQQRAAIAKRAREEVEQCRTGIDCGKPFCDCCAREVECADLIQRPYMRMRRVADAAGSTWELQLA